MRALVARSGDETAATDLAKRALEGVSGSAPDAVLPGTAARPLQILATRHALALVEARSGELGLAIELAGTALGDGRQLGDRHVEAVLENTLADLLHDAGRREESMAHLKLAVAIFAEVGGHPGDLEPEIWKLVEW